MIRDAISRVIPGFENFNARLAAEKFFYLPNAAKQRVFKTDSGQAKLSVCPIPKHDLKPDEFLLTTIRSHDQYNSTIYGLNDRYLGVFPRCAPCSLTCESPEVPRLVSLTLELIKSDPLV